ncbi:MAG: penicillin acylase family protein [Saprospiraceae bacterium]
MKNFKLFATVLITILWIYFLNKPITTKSSTIPPLGSFLSPWEGFWHNEGVKDVIFGAIHSKALTAPASITWDTRLVPHIFAQNNEDAFFLQGYTMASLRLWQIDMLARSAGGRLAEVLGGERLIQRDQQQRRLGMLFGAENAVKGWRTDKDKFKILEAFTNGINQYISELKSRDLPIEYKLMGFKPEPWTILKTACIVKYMAQSLCSRESDLEASNTKKLFGDSLFNFLYPAYFEGQSPVIPEGNKWNFSTVTIQDSVSLFKEFDGLYSRSTEVPQEGLGSNNWAVSGKKTKTGHPILCNDPHLRLTLPSIWMENHINTPDMNAYGVSVPGIPGILIGFNDSIAWGETNVGQDVADWYQISWADSTKTSYFVDNKPQKINYRIEEIKIKNKPSLLDTIKYTSWGPVVSEDLKDPHIGLAYHWIAHEIPTSFEMSVFLNLMKAKNYNDYTNALAGYSNPAQNFIFASKDGDIAITVNGKFPIKKQEQGRFVSDGSQSQNAWHGYIPSIQNPRVKNPERGYVSSANQNSTDPSYPYYYNGDFDNFRGRQVNAFLDKMTGIQPSDMMEMQNSTFSLKAKENLPLMLEALDTTSLSSEQKNIFIQLTGWDLKFSAGSNQAMIFNAWYRSVYRNTFDEIYTSKDSSVLLYPKTGITASLMKLYPDHKIFDLQSSKKIETAKDIIQMSFVETINDLKNQNRLNQTWSEFAKPKIQHMANLPGFSSDDLQVGGIGDALNATANGSGPSWRMVVSLGDSTLADVILPGGQSGNPASSFYDNMLSYWATGKYQKAIFINIPANIPALGTQSFTH